MNLILYWLLNAFGFDAFAKVTIIAFIVAIIVHIVIGILIVSSDPEDPVIGGFQFLWAVVKIILLFVFIGTGYSLKVIILANSILAGISLISLFSGSLGAGLTNLLFFIINLIGAFLIKSQL